jgi:DNA-binding NarL/FixJ family response regulator
VRPLRLLIVDDQPAFRDMLVALLGYDARVEVAGVAADGREAIRQVRLLQPDIVLMDIAMPGIDGFEATRTLSRDWPNVRVLMLTGSAANIDLQEARNAGAAGYITKAALDTIVDTILDAA